MTAPKKKTKPKPRKGGKRGRPSKSENRRTKDMRQIADELIKAGSTPLEVMLKAMRNHEKAGRWDKAAKFAMMAAPYVHPKLSSIEQKGSTDVNVTIHGGLPGA